MRPRALWPEDWPARLHAHIEAARRSGFAWGKNDCALFTCTWIFEMTGYDPAARFRGRYSTAAGAMRALKRYGAGDLVSTFEALMPARVSLLGVRRGDAVAVASALGPALGIAVDSRAVFMTPDNVVLLPVAAALAAWPIG